MLMCVMRMIMRSMTVVMSPSEVLGNDFLNQEEAYDSSNDNQVSHHLLWVMAMSLMPMAMFMMVMPVSVVMGVSRRGAAPISLTQMRKGVEEDVSQESSNCKRDQVVDHGVTERRFGQED